PRRPRPDDRDPVPGLLLRRLRLHPPLLEPTIDDRLLDALDRDRIIDQAQNARPLARRRAEPAREVREVVRGVQRDERVLPPPPVNQVVPLRDQVLHRTPGVALAERHAAIHATRALFPERLLRDRLVEVVPVLDPEGYRTIPTVDPLELQEPLRVTHGPRPPFYPNASPPAAAAPPAGGEPACTR